MGWVCGRRHGGRWETVNHQGGRSKPFEMAMTTGSQEASPQQEKQLEALQFLDPRATRAADRCGPTYLCGTGPTEPRGSPKEGQPALERGLPRPAPTVCVNQRVVLSSSGIPPREHKTGTTELPQRPRDRRSPPSK